MRPRPDRILDYREYPILYVDDEPENLRIFELAFRRDFSIITAPSGEEGLELINTTPVALVLSDHRMPGMTGVEFLTRVRAFARGWATIPCCWKPFRTTGPSGCFH